ncbi:hypothetical protein AAFF_G00251790 [Aldrovandia affinis]|uniref:Uncharacterized protein n=1 Tax=Aldrovandia affinis TaxID=143900 RepID=A0AAD7STL3_9TELE|nr:hypothetical protein AAFF_G00251790 [Aldrovandia affinis]
MTMPPRDGRHPYGTRLCGPAGIARASSARHLPRMATPPLKRTGNLVSADADRRAPKRDQRGRGRCPITQTDVWFISMRAQINRAGRPWQALSGAHSPQSRCTATFPLFRSR